MTSDLNQLIWPWVHRLWSQSAWKSILQFTEHVLYFSVWVCVCFGATPSTKMVFPVRIIFRRDIASQHSLLWRFVQEFILNIINDMNVTTGDVSCIHVHRPLMNLQESYCQHAGARAIVQWVTARLLMSMNYLRLYTVCPTLERFVRLYSHYYLTVVDSAFEIILGLRREHWHLRPECVNMGAGVRGCR